MSVQLLLKSANNHLLPLLVFKQVLLDESRDTANADLKLVCNLSVRCITADLHLCYLIQTVEESSGVLAVSSRDGVRYVQGDQFLLLFFLLILLFPSIIGNCKRLHQVQTVHDFVQSTFPSSNVWPKIPFER